MLFMYLRFFSILYSKQPLLDLVSTQVIFFNTPGAEGKEHAVNNSAVQKLSYYIKEPLQQVIRGLNISIKQSIYVHCPFNWQPLNL